MIVYKKHLKKTIAFAMSAMMVLGNLPSYVGNVYAASDGIEVGVSSIGNDALGFSTESERQAFIQSAESLPSAFDLRHVGGSTIIQNDNGRTKTVFSGGKNYITQVKFQNPFGACWSFAATSAVEGSLLYELGVTNEEFAEFNGGRELNLSEKALNWYTYHAITRDDVCEDVPESQIGEGSDISDPEVADPNSAYNLGGLMFYATSLYSSGVGPKDEYQEVNGEYPYAYHGKDKMTDYDAFTSKDPTVFAKAEAAYRKALYAEVSQLCRTMLPGATEEQIQAKIVDITNMLVANKIATEQGKTNGDKEPYAASDDWTLPNNHVYRTDTNAAILQSSHMLPSPAKSNEKTGAYEGFDEAGVAAIKSEINKGRPVSIAYGAQQNPINAQNGSPFLTSEYAQYVYEYTGINHGVAIIGYDDNFSRSNFSELKEQPPGDGAFIVKNSWGSTDDKMKDEKGELHNYHEWGVNNSGYFYLSYYDKSIRLPETFDFYTQKDEDNPLNYGDSNEYVVNQYDFMPSTGVNSVTYDGESSMANVFTAVKDEKLTHVSTQTATANTYVIYEIYKLNTGYKDPRDGALMEAGIANCEYGGYHRIPLSDKIIFPQGTKFSVVMTHLVASKEKFEVLTNCTPKVRKGLAGQLIKSNGVINEGESFLYNNDTWTDWKDFTTNVLAPKALADGTGDVTYDNFAIKAYAVPATQADLLSDLSMAQITLKKTSTDYKGTTQTPRVKSVYLNGKKVPSSAYKVTVLDGNGYYKAKAKNAGRYIVKVTAKAKNKKGYTGTGIAEYVINPVDNKILYRGANVTKKAKTYGVREKTLSKSRKKYKVKTKGNANVTFNNLSPDELKEYISYDGGYVILQKGAPKGTYQFTLTAEEVTNWNTTTSKTITINVK